MKLITLSQGKFAQVDDSDYEWLNQWKWSARKGRHTYYAFRGIWNNGKQKNIQMHRLIMDTPANMDVDHGDHNGLNCQRYNMKNATKSQNHMNTIPRGVSKYLGVCWSKSIKMWQVRIFVKGKRLFLGHFQDETKGALAYDVAAKKYFGKFANLNFKT